MSEVVRRRAQQNLTTLLRCLSEVSQKRVADLIGVSEGTVSVFKEAQLERFAAVAAACGLKLTPVTDITYDEAYIEALKTLAAIGLGHGDTKRTERDE